MHLSKAKARYHKSKAKTPYEEKVKTILELQKINNEMLSKNKRKNNRTYTKVWELVL
ncbi:MAG: hypothetical protein L3J08_00340 [Flavobacteriaceae bacterium]|nr:hypothetical protein [Flavobacteriaceae bacterium]